jgi:mevalonate kinase
MLNMEGRNQSQGCSGKIMLFGEYSIMEGSSAALIPYHKVKAYFRSPYKADNPKTVYSNEQLSKFTSYLKELEANGALCGIIDCTTLASEINSGLYLESTIPENYGLGSSGAFCVAVYRNYPLDSHELPLADLRQIFARMESFFHGTSSGVDPLCIHANEPIVIIKDEYHLPGVNGLHNENMVKPFLINTGKKSNTAAYVEEFQKNMKNREFKLDFRRQYIQVVNKAVAQWLKGQMEENTIFSLSRLQQHFFKNMIPHDFMEIWDKGIYTGMYALKLCGSGGGGMILGFTNNVSGTADYLMRNYNICIEPLGFT